MRRSDETLNPNTYLVASISSLLRSLESYIAVRLLYFDFYSLFDEILDLVVNWMALNGLKFDCSSYNIGDEVNWIERRASVKTPRRCCPMSSGPSRFICRRVSSRLWKSTAHAHEFSCVVIYFIVLLYRPNNKLVIVLQGIIYIISSYSFYLCTPLI